MVNRERSGSVSDSFPLSHPVFLLHYAVHAGVRSARLGCREGSRGTTRLIAVSAGFATMHGNNTLTINAVEAYPLDAFSTEVST